jgi:hypothetical protein
MAIDSLKAGYDILIEKPIAFKASKVKKIQDVADELGREAYCVLQVRYNPTVKNDAGSFKEKTPRGYSFCSFYPKMAKTNRLF